jgi:hypothetical protein
MDSAPDGPVIPWSNYDRETLAVGVGAVGEMMERLSTINEQLLRDVIAYAIIEGMGDDPGSVQAVPTEAVDWMAEYVEKARRLNGIVALVLRGYLRFRYVDGEPRMVATEQGLGVIDDLAEGRVPGG